jgi:tetratricopeptide (TPR) repeat protein
VLFLVEWNWPAAERSFRRALASDPAYIDAYVEYGSLMEARGDLENGLDLKRKALCPDSPLVLLAVSLSYWHQHRYEDSIEWANRALAIDRLSTNR